MRTIPALIAATLLTSGCLIDESDPSTAVLPDEPTAEDDSAIHDALEATDDSIASAIALIDALEARLGEVEATAAGAAWDVGNAEAWLESLTADVVALEAHEATQDGILVNTAARIEGVEVAAVEHTLDADAALGSHGVRLDDLEGVTVSQGLVVADMMAQSTAMEADLVTTMAAVSSVDGEVDDLTTSVITLSGETAAAMDTWSEGLDDVDERVDAVENQIILLDAFALDPSQPCLFGPVNELSAYLLAVDVDPEEIIFLDTPDDGLRPVMLTAVTCGSSNTSGVNSQPLAVTSQGQVYVLEAADVALIKGSNTPTWKVLTQG